MNTYYEILVWDDFKKKQKEWMIACINKDKSEKYWVKLLRGKLHKNAIWYHYIKYKICKTKSFSPSY